MISKTTNYLMAPEAKAMALEAQSINGSYMREETDQIMKRIVERAAMGQTTLAIYKNIDSVIIARIKHLGYNVKIYDDQWNGQSCTITWS